MGRGRVWEEVGDGARPDLQQGILAGGDDQAELEDPDVSEEALEQQQVAQEGDQAAQADAEDVLQQPPRPGETAGSGHTHLLPTHGAKRQEENPATKAPVWTCAHASPHALT